MRIIAIIIAFIITFSGCKKPQEKDYIIPIQQTLMDYFACAKSGSYFVYQDTVSGAIDTFKLSSYSDGSWGMGCDTTINSKKATYAITSYLYTSSFRNKVYSFELTSDCDNIQHSAIEMRFGAAGAIMKFNVIDNMFVLLPRTETGGDSITPIYYATYRNWGGEIFQDVIYFDSMSEDFGDLTFDIIVAKKLGIIAIKSRNDNKYWRLINKKIIL